MITFSLMNTQIKNRIEFRLFVGCVITSELKMLLNQSCLWKQAKITQSIKDDLQEVHFNQKDYIGFFLVEDQVPLSALKQIEIKILQTLKSYCPQISSEKIRIRVFSQVFIS